MGAGVSARERHEFASYHLSNFVPWAHDDPIDVDAQAEGGSDDEMHVEEHGAIVGGGRPAIDGGCDEEYLSEGDSLDEMGMGRKAPAGLAEDSDFDLENDRLESLAGADGDGGGLVMGNSASAAAAAVALKGQTVDLDPQSVCAGRKFGTAGIYKDVNGVPTPVADSVTYAYRDRRLYKFNAVEFHQLFVLERVNQKELKEFHVECERLDSDAPPEMGARASARERHEFASYYLSNFVPWAHDEPIDEFSPTHRTLTGVEGGCTRVDDVCVANAAPMPMRAPLEAMGEGNMADGGNGADGGGGMDGDVCFAEIEGGQAGYVQLYDQWVILSAAAKQARAVPPPAPFNVEQREFGRKVMAAVHARHVGRLNDRAGVEEARASGIRPVQLLYGPGGVGKSAVITKVVELVLKRQGWGRALVTAFTGVAAAPFAGPMLLSLFNLNMTTKSAKTCQPVQPPQLLLMREKFALEAGFPVDELSLLIIDECSFNEASLYGIIDHRLRLLTGRPDVMFGGIIVVLAGDNMQKAPPGGTEWFLSLIEHAAGAPDIVDAAAKEQSTLGKGLLALGAANRTVLWRIMRAKDDAQFAEAQRAMRRLDGAAPITKELLAPIKKLSKDDGEEWRFAPIACLSHCERDNFNYLQIVAFAKAFNLPLIRWRLQLAPSCAHLLSEDEMGSALEEEPAAYGYFCEGVPILFAHSIRSTRKLVNGTPGLLDSLVYKNGMPDGVRQAFARGGFSVTDSEAPYAVNARVSGGLWHGVELDDLSSLVESVASDATVVSLLLHSKETLEITLYSIKSAQFGLPAKLDVHDHGFILAFALTDFKLQGRTLPRLLISLGPRPSPPYVDINSFYVIVSRVCGYDGLRWLDCDPHEMEKLFSLRWKVQLAAWEQGFDEHGAWCPTRACSWLETQKEVIAAAREEAAKAKEAARPLDQLRHPKLKERCVALGLDAAGTRAMLIERLKRAQSVDSIPAAQKAQMRPPAPKAATPAPPKPAPSRPQAAALRTAPARPAPPGPSTAQTAQQLAEPFIAHALARFAVLRESLTTNSSALVEVAGDPAKRQHFLGVGLARAQWTDRWPANGNAAREHFVAAVQRII
ncbi:hypothetical protein Ctob_001207 [Chrysochromulina tobinii]|uniref:ATP-dependent DNA helicase n=1 Tax=Chrysochromulina tobinii TaxID=1460289 RepID=A0A0M0JK05_9EUKA|nr:hypothetical protein Ctob_001207 [Chrysochromulina tobinii]|eukprot:KOO26568.1 hypothetical protein Ctob_001207 [Chrysochromulina sp. CCMP291]